MAFCVLWCAVVLTCVLPCYGGEGNVTPPPPWEQKTDLPLSPVEKTASRCDVYIRHPKSGNKTSYTVAEYLSSKTGVNCINAISSRLRNMFSIQEAGTAIRGDLEEKQLGNVCSAFVNIMSVVIFNNDAMSGGICKDHIFDDNSVDTDFCAKMSTIDREIKTTELETTIQAFDFKWASSAAEGVTTLQDLDADDCTEKCGSGNSKVLCNAYYSIAVLFSQEFPKVLEARAKGQNKPPLTAPAPSDPSPGDSSQSGTLLDQEPSKTLSVPIQKLLSPLLSMDKKHFTTLLHSDTPEVLAKNFLTLPSDQEEILDSLKDFKQLLKMVYVVKVAGDRLRGLSGEAFDFLAKWSDNLLLSVPKSTIDDLKSMLGKDLEAVMVDVRTYKDELFAEPIQSPDSHSQDVPSQKSPPQDKNNLPQDNSSKNNLPQDNSSKNNLPQDNSSKNNLPQDNSSQDNPLQDDSSKNNLPKDVSSKTNPPQDDSSKNNLLQDNSSKDNPPRDDASKNNPPQDDSSKNNPPQDDSSKNSLPQDDSSINNPPQDNPSQDNLSQEDPDLEAQWPEDGPDDYTPDLEIQLAGDKAFAILAPLKNNKTFLDILRDVDSGDIETGMADEAKERLIKSLMESLELDKAALFAKLKEPELRKKLGVKLMDSVQENEQEENTPSRFGAFHFLGLFLLVGGAVVVGYLCLHNRKKIREGVGSYMTSDSKRRRARKYKPLATSEA